MSFTLAMLIVVAAAAVVLGLVAYHLLSRVLLLERAVLGGLEPPSRRLSREEFERTFAQAAARSRLAAQFETGLLVFLGPEADETHEITRQLAHVPRGDLVSIIFTDQTAAAGREFVGSIRASLAADLDLDLDEIGITTTPFAVVLDSGRVRGARPVVLAGDLTAMLEALA